MGGGGDDEPTPVERAAGKTAEEREKAERRRREKAEEFFEEGEDEGAALTAAGLDLEQGTFSREVLAPSRARLLRQLALAGHAPNSPIAIQAMADFDAQSARGAGDVLARRRDIEADRRFRRFQLAFGGGEDPITARALQGELETARLG